MAAAPTNNQQNPINNGNLQANNAVPIPANVPPAANAAQPQGNHLFEVRYFRHGIQDFKGQALTVREQEMLRFMNDVTERPDWQVRIREEDVKERWLVDAKKQWGLMNEMAMDWCINELRHTADIYEEHGWIGTFEASSRVIKSDCLVDETLREELVVATKPLLENHLTNLPPDLKEQMLDLIDPSMYPLVYGETRVLQSDAIGVHNFLQFYGEPSDIQARDMKEYWNDWHYEPYKSKYFQWLPTNVSFKSEDSTEIQIDSYINNLHPTNHPPLYKLIEKLMSQSVRLWNHLLFPWDSANWDLVIAPPGIGGQPGLVPPRVVPFRPFFDHYIPRGLEQTAIWGAGETGRQQKLERIKAYLKSGPQEMAYHPERPSSVNILLKWMSLREPIHPNVNVDWDEWNNEKMDPVELEMDFRSSGLQIIVKLSSIELSPEQPNYDGEEWHLDGMRNEYIVAASMYVYDVKNVTTPSMNFQMEIWLPSRLLGDDIETRHELETVFGIDDLESKSVQHLGSVAAPEGRLIAFPNTLQHKLDSISLKDQSKPGHVRFVTLMLVDPHERITSTAMVPPQQAGWLLNETWPTIDSFFELPPEIKLMVEDELDNGLMTEKEAMLFRKRLMEEMLEHDKLVQESIPSHLS